MWCKIGGTIVTTGTIYAGRYGTTSIIRLSNCWILIWRPNILVRRYDLIRTTTIDPVNDIPSSTCYWSHCWTFDGCFYWCRYWGWYWSSGWWQRWTNVDDFYSINMWIFSDLFEINRYNAIGDIKRFGNRHHHRCILAGCVTDNVEIFQYFRILNQYIKYTFTNQIMMLLRISSIGREAVSFVVKMKLDQTHEIFCWQSR